MADADDGGLERRKHLLQQHIDVLVRSWGEQTPAHRACGVVVLAALDDAHGREAALACGYRQDQVDSQIAACAPARRTPAALFTVARVDLAAVMQTLGHPRIAQALTTWNRPADIPVLVIAAGGLAMAGIPRDPRTEQQAATGRN
jgi:hypothetical protein